MVQFILSIFFLNNRDLEENQLTGSIPTEIGNLKSLKEL